MDTLVKLVENPNEKNFTLTRGGKPCVCPYVEPIILQGQMGQPVMQRIACNTDCALMMFNKVAEKLDVMLGCSAGGVIYTDVEIETKENAPRQIQLHGV